MAIFHLHVRNISRSEGRSIVAAAAYRAGETLPNEAEERLSGFGGRRDVLHAEIRLPAGAPAWMGDRARLWNAVEAIERRKDARLAKEVEVALPRELARPAWLKLARALADAYTRQGFVADLAIHDDGTAHNPHVHMLLTTRVIDGDGFGLKIRDADSVKFVNEARALWADLANAALAAAGEGSSIDPRSHAAAGLREAPGRHIGPDKAARRQKRSAMDDDRLEEARADLLNMNPRVPHPFPHLAARADWPPTSRDMPEGMTQIEKDEFAAFWDAVDARSAMLGRPRPSPAIDDTYPVPGPHGELLAPSEQARAEDAMLKVMEGSAQPIGGALYPTAGTDDGRSSPRRAVPDEPEIELVPLPKFYRAMHTMRHWAPKAGTLEGSTPEVASRARDESRPTFRRWQQGEARPAERSEEAATERERGFGRWQSERPREDNPPQRDQQEREPQREDDRDWRPKR